MYICKHFGIKELVTPELYKMFQHNQNVLWRMFNEDVLRGADWFRERYGPMFINTWSFSDRLQFDYGIRTESGLRHVGCKYYSPNSMHSKGGAWDALFLNHTAQYVRDDLRTLDIVPYIKRIERGVDWIHADIKIKIGYKGLYFFNP